MADFTIPQLNDLRARILAGDTPSDAEMAQILRHLAEHRKAVVQKADEKSRSRHVDLAGVFGVGVEEK